MCVGGGSAQSGSSISHGKRKLVDRAASRSGRVGKRGEVHARALTLMDGRRRIVMRAQRVKMEDLGSAFQTWAEMFDRYKHEEMFHLG